MRIRGESWRPALCAGCMGALWLMVAGSALAQETTTLRKVQVEAAADSEVGYNAGSAQSGTKIDAPLRDIPQTINVVPSVVMRDQQAVSMQDVMKNIPGIGLSTGDGQRDQVTIRGFSAIADQFIDGFRDDALYYRDLSDIERVEVIKGPAAVLYGRGSSGGLINRVTKKPGIDLSEATLSYGRWNDVRTTFDMARRTEPVAWRLTGAWEDSDSYRDQQFLRRKAIAPSVQFNLSAMDTVLLQGEYLKDRRLTDSGVPAYHGRPVEVPAHTYFGAANARQVDYSESRVYSARLDYTHRFSDIVSLRTGLRYYDYSLDRNNTLPANTADETTQTVALNHTHRDRNEHGWFNQTELTQRLQFGKQSHALLYGFEVGQQNKDQFNRQRNNVAVVSLFNPMLPVLPLAVTTPPTDDNLGVMKVVAAYVQDVVTFTPQWKALLGVRYDRFRQLTYQHLAGQPNLSRLDTTLSPRVGVVWQPTPMQSYYASWSRSFQPSGEAFAITTSNVDIAPEKTVNKEVGAKLDFLDGRMSATISVFRLQRDHIKITDPASNRLMPLGTQRTDGAEVTLLGALNDGWQWLAGYAYLDSRMIESVALDAGVPIKGKQATLTPRHSANLWLKKLFAHGFSIGAGANYVDDRFANPGNTVTLPGYTTADAMAAYAFAHYEVQLNLRNVFDRDYIVAGHGTSPNLNLPGAPRNATLTLRAMF